MQIIIKETTLTAPDGKELFCYQWIPEDIKKCKGCVLVIHGMADHAARFKRISTLLCENGYVVYAYDQRGHGKTAGTTNKIGIISDSHSLDLLVEDVHFMVETLKKDFKNLPVFIFAHSMGSFVAQGFIQKYGTTIKGLALSGSNGSIGIKAQFARIIAKAEIKKHGRNYRSEKLNALSFGSYNKAFKPNRTAFDWLTSVNEEVDAYIQDPYCGDVFPAGFFYDMADFLHRIQNKKNIAKVPVNLPIGLFSGEIDPVGGKRGVEKLYKAYRDRGVTVLYIKLYPQSRHEIINEKNHKEVEQEILAWIEKNNV